jgi:hypothetical protein
LAKDLPRYFVCHVCCLLHLSSGVPPPGPTESRLYPHNFLYCVWYDNRFSHRLPCSPYILKFAHVQLAIKRHHYGLDHGVSLDAFSHTEVEESHYEEFSTTVLLSVDARIASDELLMRSQQWIVLPTNKRDRLLSNILPVSTICTHITGHREGGKVWGLIKSWLDRFDGKQTCSTAAGTLQCQYCYMDFEIDIRDLGERGTALVFTRWINLGAGLNPSDSKWQGHHIKYNHDHPTSLNPGSIRSSFEEQRGLPVDELAVGNKARLFSNRKHSQRHCGPDGYTWVLYREGLWHLASCNKEDTRAESPLLHYSVVAGLGFTNFIL